MKVYYYPPDFPSNRDFVKNPYSKLFKESISQYYNVINKNSIVNISIIDLLKNVFSLECIIFNWIENLHTRKLGIYQFFLFLLILQILRVRKVKIIWVLHNFHPHKGEHIISKIIKHLMFRYSHLIVTHSKAAMHFAKKETNKKVVFFNHPINPELLKFNTDYNPNNEKYYDILIWGSIEPYKGVLEFLQYVNTNNIKWKIRIVGRCKINSYEKEIRKLTSSNITFENKAVSFEYLSSLIKTSKFVLFPYKSTSVSSSGALMDTIALLGNIIGPNIGAFQELKEDNICKTFNSYEDIDEIVNSREQNNLAAFQKFIDVNSWSNFGLNLKHEIDIL
ncbi:glycosyltransferase family protein [Marinilabilia salmonicolor]|uniref:glycosyltransferase n=1 Tax=Marinilabilia salmonicolor TaxID=989 RepID=UPI0002E53446|nr:glycosyltransferase [Marinilabilia salmonicolor]